ncbi:hypothetical protein ABI_11500 [Asticcacaulis biprosthecium C19]|uniref:Putative auto-transporter adhesin head GIN domain-containing protein n=1 Tax=Asticcacaulis biprosthecium C19 TaxID=715226 RepID=F4QHH6_9CAUL|nr:DUF2807 domain-containing protein [Asticcacaulis biprosthecium]EGF92713.1 hypothetical protein ABI_11500 [Asticcacaulis biprosthecium C19]
MIRTLLLVTGFGTAIALVCLTAAASIAGHDISNGYSISFMENDNHIGFRKDQDVKPEPVETKTLAWAGGEVLTISAPVEVVYTQGPTVSVSATGPKSLVDRLVLDNGRLSLKDGPGVVKTISLKLNEHGLDVDGGDDTIRVTITAPSVKQFEVAGMGDLTIHGYDQPELDLRISGAGEAEVFGKTEALELDISGNGDANLEALKAVDADVSISGAGDADISATGKVSVDVSGMGDVTLKTKPTSLSTDISGAGEVTQE